MAATPSVKEPDVRSLSIAQLYFNVHDYEYTRQYVTRYLSTKNDSSEGHKLLAQCHEYLGQMGKALSEYQCSLQLDSNQPELVVRAVSDNGANEIDSADQEHAGEADTAENYDCCLADELDLNSSLEYAATLLVLEDGIALKFAGVTKIVPYLHSESDDETNGFVDFPTDTDVHSLCTLTTTRGTIAIYEGDTVTFPTPSETDSNCKASFRFSNENLAQSFYNAFLKMKSCGADRTECLEDST